MEYIRDEDRLRTESCEELCQRISGDYAGMQSVYTEDFRYVPLLYVLMHSNTHAFGTNADASEQNRINIEKTFGMNMNREGSCLNNRESSAYDLTRMQPQANRYVNHLLMRIRDDTDDRADFKTGDEAQNWEISAGAAEYRGDTIVVTSEPSADGSITLKDFSAADMKVSVTLDGNVAGCQGICLRADEDLKTASTQVSATTC